MDAQNPEIVGRKLRDDLQRNFVELGNSGKLDTGMAGTDVTGIVLEHISPGMSFEVAENILRVARFSVGSHPGNHPAIGDPNLPRDWYAVVASSSLTTTQGFAKAAVYVTVFPPRPGDYTRVVSLTAKLLVSLP